MAMRNTTQLRVSVLDTQWPGYVPDLVPVLDQVGYHRYWATEHHSKLQSASPVIVAALAAGLSSRLRAGTAGVLLRLTSALRVAEDFALLELYYPGRIDLGIAGASAGGSYDEEYQKDVVVADDAKYEDRLRRLVAFVRTPPEQERARVRAGPVTGGRPELWVCGTGMRSAVLAGSLGLRFAYHHYLGQLNGLREPALDIAEAYRRAFVAHEGLPEPYLAIACYGACASSESEAAREWKAHFGEARAIQQPTFLGDPESAMRRLEGLAHSYGAAEVLVDCFMSSFEARLAGLQGLGNHWAHVSAVWPPTKGQ